MLARPPAPVGAPRRTCWVPDLLLVAPSGEYTQDLDAVLAQGREEGLQVARAAVCDLCEVLGVPLTLERRASLAKMGTTELDALRERLKRERRWD